MNLAVKFQKDNPNRPLGMPNMWPWDCREIGELVEYTAEPGPWVIMSVEEYEDYLVAARGLYEHYENVYLGENDEVPKLYTFRGSWIRVKAALYGDQPPADLIPPEVGEWHSEEEAAGG